MQSLIFPGILLLAVAVWGVLSAGGKFRREFMARGKSWDEVCASVKAGEGFLVVDRLAGPRRGLGFPVTWWVPTEMMGQEDLSEQLEAGGAARLVKCPRALRSVEALRKEFGSGKVRGHGWDIGEASRNYS